MRTIRLLAVAALAAASSPANAQVGYPPNQSPFRDLRETHALTFYSGYFRAKKDPARVAPRSGPMVGLHYEWRASGPAHLTLDLSLIHI